MFDFLFFLADAISRFLRITFIANDFVYLDLWSLVHLSSGLILGWLFFIYSRRSWDWLSAFVLLVLYEIFEIVLTGIMFEVETSADRFWDLIIGMIGFIVTRFYFHKK